MENKVCVVTGGNKGIGYEIVKALVQQRNQVALVSRSRERGEKALAQLQSEVPEESVTLVTGDLGTIADTRQFAKTLLERFPRIDVLVNNAGVWPTKKAINADGLEESFMVNFLAPLMLSHLLKDRLAASAPARIVHVNAGLYVRGRVDLQRTPYGADFSRMRTYADSKLCGVLTLAREAAMFAAHGVTVNMVHPGVVNTDLGQMGGVLGWVLKQVKRSWKTPQEGAAAPVWLASSADVAGKTGLYFNEYEVMALDNAAKDEQLAADLWRFAEGVAGINQRLETSRADSTVIGNV
jgi:NAD(P)-dependent dehydrogenase (short-subunit alcohol dehydrogenase family)